MKSLFRRVSSTIFRTFLLLNFVYPNLLISPCQAGLFWKIFKKIKVVFEYNLIRFLGGWRILDTVNVTTRKCQLKTWSRFRLTVILATVNKHHVTCLSHWRLRALGGRIVKFDLLAKTPSYVVWFDPIGIVFPLTFQFISNGIWHSCGFSLRFHFFN